jgi:protein-disulfide isomerase
MVVAEADANLPAAAAVTDIANVAADVDREDHTHEADDDATEHADAAHDNDRAEAFQEILGAVVANARHFNGDPEAPITMVEFGDFSCGYCGKWVKETLPLIQENYIDTGQVRMAYVHYPILGSGSMKAAEAAECAADQDRFWEYHNLLYTNQRMGFTPANLTNLAAELDMDTTAFEQCLAEFPAREALETDILLGQTLGVRGTPAFLVNNVPLAGAYPYEDFEKVIEGVVNGEF